MAQKTDDREQRAVIRRKTTDIRGLRTDDRIRKWGAGLRKAKYWR
jgi:hypothetical protein